MADNAGFSFDCIGYNRLDDNGSPQLQTAGQMFGSGRFEELGSDGYDFLVAEFVDLPAIAKQDFLQVNDAFFFEESVNRSGQIVGLEVIGYPDEFIGAEWDTSDDYDVKLNAITLRRHFVAELSFADRDNWDDTYLIPMDVKGGFEEVDPRGLSGSPVFCYLLSQKGQIQFGLLGVATRANRSRARINALPAVVVGRRLKDIIDEEKGH